VDLKPDICHVIGEKTAPESHPGIQIKSRVGGDLISNKSRTAWVCIYGQKLYRNLLQWKQP